MQRPDFPLTIFLCDLIRFDMGTLTANDIRNRWKAGDYRGVSNTHATAYAREFGV